MSGAAQTTQIPASSITWLRSTAASLPTLPFRATSVKENQIPQTESAISPQLAGLQAAAAAIMMADEQKLPPQPQAFVPVQEDAVGPDMNKQPSVFRSVQAITGQDVSAPQDPEQSAEPEADACLERETALVESPGVKEPKGAASSLDLFPLGVLMGLQSCDNTQPTVYAS